MRTTNHDLKIELGYLRDNLIEAISQGKTAAVGEGLETYDELVNTFLEMLKKWGAEYDRERALQELTGFEEGWSEIEWIQSDLREIIEAALQSQNVSVIREVSRFPIRLAHDAYSAGDYFTFYKFLNWVPDMYFSSVNRLQANEQEATKVKEFIVEMSWPRLAELGNYLIGPDLARARTKEAIVKHREYAEGVILILNRLLKYAFDARLIDDFGTFRRTLGSLFEHQESEIRDSRARQIEWKLRTIEDLGEREKLQKQRELLTARLDAIRLLTLKRRLVLFGMNAWILHEYNSGKLRVEECKSWHNAIPAFGSLEETWQLFLQADEHETEKDFNWHWWELDERSEPGRLITGGAYIGFSAYLRLVFCVRSLEFLGRISTQQRTALRLSPSSSLLHLAERPDSPLIKILSEIEQQRERWEPIIEQAGYEALPDFKALLARAVEEQKRTDEERLIHAPLSSQRISAIKQNVLDHWEKNADARHIVKEYGKYEFDEQPSDRERHLGYNMIDRKDVYVDDSGISVFDWGKQYGEGLANGENKIFFATLTDSLQQIIGNPIALEEVERYIETARTTLEQSGFNPIIIILNSWLAARNLEALKTAQSFTYPSPGTQSHRLLGFYREKPILNLQYGTDPMILIVDLKKFGVWRQFKPNLILGDEERITDELLFYVKAYDRRGAEELIQRQPSLLRDDDSGPEKDREEVIRELMQRLNLRIMEDFEFNVTEPRAGYKIVLADDF